MARLASVVVPAYPHHITQRGNRRVPAFFCDDDHVFRALMAEHRAACSVKVWAWWT
jgi:putative transposase